MRTAVPGKPSSPTSGRTVDRFKAIGLMCLAVTCFSVLDTTAKYLGSVALLPTSQVVWVRFLGQLIAIIFTVGAVSVPAMLRSTKHAHQLVRSLLMLGATALNFLALRELRLDQTVTIAFMAPLVVALLAGPLLGEWVGWRRMTAIVVGFCGILIVMRPGFGSFQPAILLAMAAMLCYALFMLLTRYLSHYDPPEVTLFYSLLAGTALVAPFALTSWVWPATSLDWLLLASLGISGGLGHYLLILAYHHAPASTVAPFIYVQLLSMIALGYIVFDQLPDLWTLAGAGVVIASGAFLLYRERKTRELGAARQGPSEESGSAGETGRRE